MFNKYLFNEKTFNFRAFVNPVVEVESQGAASTDDIYIVYQLGYWRYAIDLLWNGVGRLNMDDDKKGCGMRFPNCNIPNDAKIINAYLEFTSGASGDKSPVYSRITGELTDDAAPFSDLDNYQARRGTVVGGATDDNITKAFFLWEITSPWVADEIYRSPVYLGSGIAPIIQEIVDLPTWVSGNAIALFWDDHDGRTLDDATTRWGYSWDYDPAKAVKLVVQYQEYPTIILPKPRFIIEVRDTSGNLLAILRDISEPILEQAVNTPDILSITIPTTSYGREYITRINELWVRDTILGTVISKTKLLRTEDTH